jgi:hypothetical protein
MGATVEQVAQLLNLLREVDLPTLLAFDRKLHLLLEQKEEERLRTRQGTTIQEEFCQRYPHIPIAPDLLALVGVQPANPVEENKTLLREAIAWRLQD